MRGKTATKKELAALSKQFEVASEDQEIIDVHHGFAIVFDRVAQKFTVIPPFAKLRLSPFNDAKWTTNVRAAYRAAEQAGREVQSRKPIPVVYRYFNKGNEAKEYAFGLATIEAGRILIHDENGERTESNYFEIWHWPGTKARALRLIATMNKAIAALYTAEKNLKKEFGRRARYIDEIALIQAGVKPTKRESAE